MYDIFFISYYEENADGNWNYLKSRFPSANRIDKVKGLLEAHKKAASLSNTMFFWVVDGDNFVHETFDFSFKWDAFDLKDKVCVWYAMNAVNKLCYGFGGIKLLPKLKVLSMDTYEMDFTMSISNNFVINETVASTTYFNSNPKKTWITAFKEVLKLYLTRNNDRDFQYRIDSWCSIGNNAMYGQYAMDGAKAGLVFGKKTNKWILEYELEEEYRNYNHVLLYRD